MATEQNLASLRSFAQIDVRDFYSSRAVPEMKITEHFELALLAISKVLKFGLDPGNAADASALERLQPIETAFLVAARDFRNHLRQHTDIFPDNSQNRKVFAALVNADLAKWAEQLAAWLFRFDNGSPPVDFAQYPSPPVIVFEGVNGFVGAGNGVFQMLAVQQSNDGPSNKRRFGDSAASAGSGSGTKKARSGSSSGRRPSNKFCRKFEKSGSCSFGGDCIFRHGQDDPRYLPGGSRREAEQGGASAGAAGGSGSSGGAGEGGNSGGGGGSSGGGSSAIVVRGSG